MIVSELLDEMVLGVESYTESNFQPLVKERALEQGLDKIVVLNYIERAIRQMYVPKTLSIPGWLRTLRYPWQFTLILTLAAELARQENK